MTRNIELITHGLRICNYNKKIKMYEAKYMVSGHHVATNIMVSGYYIATTERCNKQGITS